MKVPLLDLQAQYATIRDEVRAAVDRVFESQHFVLGGEVQALEEEIGRTLNPASMTRVYKTNTWAPAPRADALRLIEETDFALVGVGA